MGFRDHSGAQTPIVWALETRTIKLDDPVYLVQGAGSPEYSATRYRVSYTWPLAPATVISVDMATGARAVLKQQEVVGGYDATRFESRRPWGMRAMVRAYRCGRPTKNASNSMAA